MHWPYCVLTSHWRCLSVECFIPTDLHLANLQAAHFLLVTLSILHSPVRWQVKTWPLILGWDHFWRNFDILRCYSYALLKDLYMMEVLTNRRQGFWLSGSTSSNLTLQLILYIRCGRVMADNIAYAKFRKTLLIW